MEVSSLELNFAWEWLGFRMLQVRPRFMELHTRRQDFNFEISFKDA